MYLLQSGESTSSSKASGSCGESVVARRFYSQDRLSRLTTGRTAIGQAGCFLVRHVTQQFGSGLVYWGGTGDVTETVATLGVNVDSDDTVNR